MGNHQTPSLKKEQKKTSFFFNFIKILGLFFSICVIIFLLNANFKINQIVCFKNNQDCSQEIKDQTNFLLGKSLFFTNFDKTLSQFENYKIEKNLSGKIILNLSENEFAFYQIGENGIIEKTNETKIDKKINQKINLLIENLEKNQITYEQLIFIDNQADNNENFFIIKFNENLRAIIDFNDLENGIYKLKQILDNFELKEIDLNIKEIDTRFKMPVLKTKYSEI